MIKLLNTKYRVFSHIIFWIFILCLFILPTIFMGGYRKGLILVYFLYLPSDILITYIVIYFLIPKFLFKEKIFLFIIAYVILIMAYTLLIALPYEYVVLHTFFKEKTWIDMDASMWINYRNYVKSTFLWSIISLFMITGFAASVKVSKYWILMQQEKQLVEKDKYKMELKLKEAELKFLKSQIHPHFLFNTLNNLYGLILEKSDLAADVVVKLSEMLDYMLYDCNENKVPLESEIKLINNYISLEKIRHDEALEIEFNIKGNYNKLKIAPLILLPFIENGFKHGVSKQTGSKWLQITLEINDKILTYQVRNSKENGDQSSLPVITEGIGIKNLRKRLELQYKNNHKLVLEDKRIEYISILELNIES